MAQKSNRLLLAAILVVAALLGGVSYLFRDYFEPGSAQVMPMSDCNLHEGSCETRLPGGGIVLFGIQPRDIPLSQPLQIQVQIQGRDTRTVSVDFAGVGMNMGFNRPRLQKVSEGRFEGEGMLPVCIRQRMEWEARLMLDTAKGMIIIPHRFVTTK